MLNRLLFRNIIIAFIIALVVIIALIAATRYFIVHDKRVAPKPPSPSVPISDEVLRSLTPPKDAKPVEIPQSVLNSLTPPERR